jgi:hypothetical protein
MPIETIEFKGKQYPKHEAEGFAARWIFPFANYYLKGNGLDIGCNRLEWCLPGATPVDPEINEYSAMNLPIGTYDFIFSSHMLEHLEGNWMTCLDYWLTVIKENGILFLYLPHSSQEYWLPENNRKHVHSFSGLEIKAYLQSKGHKVFVSGVDFNHSFVVVCEKMGKAGLPPKETTKAYWGL